MSLARRANLVVGLLMVLATVAFIALNQAGPAVAPTSSTSPIDQGTLGAGEPAEPIVPTDPAASTLPSECACAPAPAAAAGETTTMIITADASGLDPNGVVLDTREPGFADRLNVTGLAKDQYVTVQHKEVGIVITINPRLDAKKNCKVEVQTIKDGKVIDTYVSGLPKSPVVIKDGNIELVGLRKGQYNIKVTCDK